MEIYSQWGVTAAKFLFPRPEPIAFLSQLFSLILGVNSWGTSSVSSPSVSNHGFVPW